MTLRRLLLFVLALAVVAAACGGDDDDSDTTAADGGGDTTAADAGGEGDLTGTIAISGSSTVEPISALVGQQFSDANPGVAVAVDGPGTGDGFQLFCSGETDISDASRPISEEEIALCTDAGIEYLELQVGIDGLSVLTNPANTALSCLTFADMYALVGPESTGFGNWSDANDLATELGGTGGFPDAELVITAPGEESGTYDTFVEFVVADLAEERGQEEVTRPDYTASPNDNVIIEGVQGSESSFGWVGFAFYTENQDAVKAFEIDGGEGCVAPTVETIADGSYPMSRPLFIYVNTANMAEKPELAAFVQHYFSDEGLAAVTDAGYVALDSYDEQRAAIGS